MISRNRRLVAGLCTVAALSMGVPATASADDFWGLWASELRQRVWWEMPFAALFSFPAMVVTTPFWAGDKAYGAIKNRGGDDEEDDY